MEISHRIAFNGDPNTRFLDLLRKFDIPYSVSPLPNTKIGLVYFDILESHTNWNEVRMMNEQTGVSDSYDTLFTNEEIREAVWCRLIPTYQQGYPEPQKTWVANPVTYSGVCKVCGTYEKQVSSFRVHKDPKLSQYSFLSLHWAYPLFAAPHVLNNFEQNNLTGFELWNVIIHRTDELSEAVKQVHILNQSPGHFLPTDDVKRKTCGTCGITKYHPHKRGYMRFSSKLLDSSQDFLSSSEWFGDGHMAYKEILVSSRVTDLILKHKWKGVALKPVKIE